jgi:4-amino-4-deoxy-L-arabinose transferase-like glycosyltransferase
LPILDRRRATWIAAFVALGVAVAMRVHNAIHYTLLWGFDAKFNWRYIQRLTLSWELPPPDADWSTAHPPFFYYASAGICRLIEDTTSDFKIVALRLLVSAAGLAIAGLAVALVRRIDPDNPERAALAGILVLFLPVHVYMSAMVTEEIVASMLMSVVLLGAAFHLAGPRDGISWKHVTWMGVVGGLALLTKLTGVLALAAVAGAYLIDAWRRGTLRQTLGPVASMLLIGAVVGGWFYARNLIEYGYLYPHGLETHKIMFTMPPGERWLSDYLRLPLAIWTDPQAVNPDLLRSIWGSTYVSLWFDGHRVFLPRNTPAVTHVGTVILTLALIPTSAFGLGILRGGVRAWRTREGVDSVLLLLVGLTLAGYVAFTWKNPWFVTSKGSFLLCLSVPFAYYASEVLVEWLRRPGWTRVAMAVALVGLLVAIVGTFTFSELFWDTHHMRKPGVLW